MAYLSQSWYIFNNGSIRFDPSDFRQWSSTALTNDFSSGRVGKIHLVWWLLYKHWARHIALGRNWKQSWQIDFSDVLYYKNTMINLHKNDLKRHFSTTVNWKMASFQTFWKLYNWLKLLCSIKNQSRGFEQNVPNCSW